MKGQQLPCPGASCQQQEEEDGEGQLRQWGGCRAGGNGRVHSGQKGSDGEEIGEWGDLMCTLWS